MTGGGVQMVRRGQQSHLYEVELKSLQNLCGENIGILKKMSMKPLNY
jgi:hypothetical protein